MILFPIFFSPSRSVPFFFSYYSVWLSVKLNTQREILKQEWKVTMSTPTHLFSPLLLLLASFRVRNPAWNVLSLLFPLGRILPFPFFILSNKKTPLLCHRRRCCVILKCDVSVQCTHHVNVRYVLSLPHPPTPPPILFGANVQSAELTRYKAQRSEGEGNERDIRFFSRCSFIHHCVMFI